MKNGVILHLDAVVCWVPICACHAGGCADEAYGSVDDLWWVRVVHSKQAAEEVGGALTNERNVRVDDARARRSRDMASEEGRAAVVELVRRAMDELSARAGETRLSAVRFPVSSPVRIPAIS